MQTRPAVVILLVVIAAVGSSCTPPSGPKTIPVEPLCTIYCAVRQDQVPAWNSRVFVSDRRSSPGSSFSPFRVFSGPGVNSAAPIQGATGAPDTFSIREAWTPFLGSNVFRGFVTPAQRKEPSEEGGLRDFHGSSWRSEE